MVKTIFKQSCLEETQRQFKGRICGGWFGFTDHCRGRMAERQVDLFDVFKVTYSGDILYVERNSEFNNWEYRIKGKDMKGDDLTVITAIGEKRQTLFFITVFD